MFNKPLTLLCIGALSASLQASNITFENENAFNTIKLINEEKSSNYASMFELTTKQMSLTIVGIEKSNLSVMGEISYYQAKADHYDTIVSHLVSLDMKKESAALIATMLKNGITTSNQCIGNRSDCIVSGTDVQYVVDYYNSEIRIFPSSTMFVTEKTNIRLQPSNNHGLISQFYGNVAYTEDAQYYVNSENIFGLGLGYVSASGRLSENQTVLEEFNYTYEGDGFTSSFGFMEGNQSLGIASQGNIVDNNYVGYAFSNRDALKLRNLNERKVQFFSSFEGDYEVLKDDKVIHRAFARTGTNTIPYSSLPRGSYKIKIQIKHKDEMILIGEDYVSNINNYEAGERSYYFRSGFLNEDGAVEKDIWFADAGINFPLTEASSVIGNLAFIDKQLFIGGGAYVNFTSANLNANTYFSSNQFKGTFGLYSGFFNINGSYDLDKSGNDSSINESASLFTGLNYNWGNVNFNLNVGYSNNDSDEYINYNLGVGYFSPKGWSLQSSVTNPYGETQLQTVLNIPLSFGLRNSLSVHASDDQVLWRNSVSGAYAVNNELNLNGMVNTDFSSYESPQTDIRFGVNYSNDYASTSFNVNKVGATKGVSGSISTTAYATIDGIELKNSLDNENSFIQVHSKDGSPIKGHIKLKDSLSQATQEFFIDSNEAIKIRDYSRKKLTYEFDTYEYLLVDANIRSGTDLDFTPGKVHQLLIEQQPIANVLVVWNSSFSDAPICEGVGCISQQIINDNAVRFLVSPDKPISIKGGETMCFAGSVGHGQTKKGVCK